VPLFGRKKQPQVPEAASPEHAVLIHLTSPAAGAVALDEIEEPLMEAIDEAGVGEFDGNEIGPDGATLYMYGPDADRLFSAVEPILRNTSFPPGSHAIVRYGGPGAEERRVDL
jgi:hypothetical protein